jgi:hypothetical protein
MASVVPLVHCRGVPSLVIRGCVVVVGEVTSLEVDALALVTTDERLITVVAQPLPATLLLLGRGQATEGASRRTSVAR